MIQPIQAVHYEASDLGGSKWFIEQAIGLFCAICLQFFLFRCFKLRGCYSRIH